MRSRRGMAVGGLLALSGAVAAEETVTVPWREFRDLYRQQVAREIEGGRPAEADGPVVVVEESDCRLAVGAEGAVAALSLSGRVLAGPRVPLPILPPGVVVSRVAGAQGGALEREGAEGGLRIRPQGEGPFRIALDLLLPVREDDRSKRVDVPLPPAVRSAVSVSLPSGVRLVEPPGIAGEDGVFHVVPARTLAVRFEAERALSPPPAAEIDVLTRVEPQGSRVVLTAAFLPARPPSAPVVVRLPGGAAYLACSLKGSWVREVAGGAVTIAFPPGTAEGFTLQCVLESEAGEAGVGFGLPVLEGNAGREGAFVLAQPEDGEAAVEGALPAAALPASVRGRAESLLGPLPDRLFRLPPGGRAKLVVRRYDAVATPDVVLDDVYFATAFEEGGGAFSLLRLVVPPAAGPRLRLRAVPGAEVWSVAVNGRETELYALEAGSWIVPLGAGGPSRVELTFLRRGPKLGLQGRLETAVPATGLPARSVHVAVVLPPRVELVSAEGDFAAAPGAAWELPGTFAGRRHGFRRAFDRGEGLAAAFLYKEPVEQEPRR